MSVHACVRGAFMRVHVQVGVHAGVGGWACVCMHVCVHVFGWAGVCAHMRTFQSTDWGLGTPVLKNTRENCIHSYYRSLCRVSKVAPVLKPGLDTY